MRKTLTMLTAAIVLSGCQTTLSESTPAPHRDYDALQRRVVRQEAALKQANYLLEQEEQESEELRVQLQQTRYARDAATSNLRDVQRENRELERSIERIKQEQGPRYTLQPAPTDGVTVEVQEHPELPEGVLGVRAGPKLYLLRFVDMVCQYGTERTCMLLEHILQGPQGG